MIKQILGTAFSRTLITIIGVIILSLNTRYLGAEKLGELSLLLIALHLILQVSELVGGAALVYLQNKHKTNKLLSISYLWAFVVSAFAYLIIKLFFIEINLVFTITLCAFIQSLNHSHLHLLVGKEKIKYYNLSTVIQIGIVFILILFFYLFKGEATILVYLNIYLVGQLITLFFTTYYLSGSIKIGGSPIFDKELVVDMYRYGFIIQLANIFQFGVYRINYIILEAFTSLSTLGIYTLGNQLSEKALIPGKAISMVQYAKISNIDDKNEASQLTIKLLTVSVIIGFFAAIALIVIPEELISLLFGGDFGEAKSILVYLAPGIVFMSISTIYSHYFAGLGKYKFNTMVSFIGILAIAALSYSLIPIYGMKGAAIATSIVYLIQAFVQVQIFKKVSNLSWAQIMDFHQQSLKNISFKEINNWINR